MARPIILDDYGQPIEHFTQWDNNRFLTIKGLGEFATAPEIHYWDLNTYRAIVVPTAILPDGGGIRAQVPNILMTRDRDIVFSVYKRTEGNQGVNLCLLNIPVLHATQPEDYDWAENIDYISFKQLIEEAMKLIGDLEFAKEQIVYISKEALEQAKKAAKEAASAADAAEAARKAAEATAGRDNILVNSNFRYPVNLGGGDYPAGSTEFIPKWGKTPQTIADLRAGGLKLSEAGLIFQAIPVKAQAGLENVILECEYSSLGSPITLRNTVPFANGSNVQDENVSLSIRKDPVSGFNAALQVTNPDIYVESLKLIPVDLPAAKNQDLEKLESLGYVNGSEGQYWGWGKDGFPVAKDMPKQVFTAVITTEVSRLVCDMTASQIIDASRKGVVKAEYTDGASGETREYYYFKQMPDGRACFTKDGYIENGVPKQTLFYVDYAGNVEVETRDPSAVTCYATCGAEAAPPKTVPVTWYVPKTMPRPSGNPGMMIDVFWQNGRSDGLGYDISLVWGEEGGADNEIIVPKTSVADPLTGEYSIPTEGTVRYQLEESSGRLHWRYVSGDLISKQFSSDTAADVADKLVPGMEIAYLPGMDIFVQLDHGNTADLMRLIPAEGATLPVYGNGTGAKTGPLPAGYILHLKNAGDHWQILNSGGGAIDDANISSDTTWSSEKTHAEDLKLAIKPTASGEVIAVDDSAEFAIPGLHVYGKTVQNGVPTPDAPVPLETAGADGEITESIGGKNVANVSVQGTVMITTVIQVPAKESLCLSSNISMDGKNSIFLETEGGVRLATEKSKNYLVYTPSSDLRVQCALYKPGGDFTGINFQVEFNNSPTEYSPYLDPQSLPISLKDIDPNGLPGIPVESGGNYTDSNGQQWICDEIDFERGVYVKRTGYLASAKKGLIGPSTILGETVRQAIRTPGGAAAKVRSMSSALPYVNDYVGDVPHFYVDKEYGQVFVPVGWWDSHDTDILYALKEPIETPLPPGLLTAYKQLHTNYPATTVFNDQGTGQKLIYVADPNLYLSRITRRISALENQAVNNI